MENQQDKLEELELKTETHIVQGEERWKTNFKRLDDIDFALRRIEARTMAVGGGLILFLAGLIVTLLVE